jgi:lipoprotein-releasing system ATP-binding protein
MAGVDSAAIRAAGLGKRYRSGAADLVIFEGLDLTVEPGESVAVVGESGAGKSTLLHLLAGLEMPTTGAVEIFGKNLNQMDEAAVAELRNREIGFVWQMNTLLPEFSAAENVMLPLLIRGAGRAEAAPRAAALLAEVGLAARAHHLAGELSGGEQQRVALARALANAPRILLADEPTGNLDEATGDRIMDLLGELHERHGLTSVYVTHNPRFANRCGRIIKLERGVLVDQEGAH